MIASFTLTTLTGAISNNDNDDLIIFTGVVIQKKTRKVMHINLKHGQY